MSDAKPSASISAALEEATRTLGDAGVLNAKREATAIWAAVEGVKPGDVWMKRDTTPTDDTLKTFRKAVQRRTAGVPFPYAVGRASFRHLDLKLDVRALIPRPETEGLVGLVLEWATGRPGGRAADIGTGCGCIALSLAMEGTFKGVVATDASPETLLLAQENLARVKPAVPVEVRCGDLLDPLKREAFRVIVSNPPYLTDAEYEGLEQAVKDFEPRAALASGPDGLDATRRLLTGGQANLEPGGLLALEIDERRASDVASLARARGWRGVTIHDDLFGRPRYALAYAPEEDGKGDGQ